MPNDTKTSAEEYIYPHQKGDGNVTLEDLENDAVKNPEKYHPSLLPHIEKHLGKQATGQAVETADHDSYAEVEKAAKIGQINNDRWQNHLSQALKDEDFQLIRTLQRMHPEVSVDPELVTVMMLEVVTARPDGWEGTYRNFKAVSDTTIDPSILTDEFGNLLEQCTKGNADFGLLRSFKSTTGCVPSIEGVQDIYKSLLRDVKEYDKQTISLVENLVEITSIPLDETSLSEVVDQGDIVRAKDLAGVLGITLGTEIIQLGYEAEFSKKGYLSPYTINAIAAIAEMPSANLVARAYKSIIEKKSNTDTVNNMHTIKSLEQATGVKPVFTEEQIRPLFEELFRTRFNYHNVGQLIEMTGIKPSVDLVEKAALVGIDYVLNQAGSAERIKEMLDDLRKNMPGVDFEIQESEIQLRYQQATAGSMPNSIINLYGALGIRPNVNEEDARQFMVALMATSDINRIPELEIAFGLRFEATEEEIETKQDENLGMHRFDNLTKIKELTGKDCTPEKIEAALIKWLQKAAVVSSGDRESYGDYWEIHIQQLLEQFNITIPPEAAINIYTNLIQSEVTYSKNLMKVSQITGALVPEDLAQQAYRKYISSEYTYSSYDSVAGAFEELFKISGVKPEISNNELQVFYRSSLEKDSSGLLAGRIVKISEITGVKPEFDPNDINGLYKEWILSGLDGRIGAVENITGIKLQLDDETSAYIAQKLEDTIEYVHSHNYEKEQYDTKVFDGFSMEIGLRQVRSLIASTGLNPDPESLQSIYSDIVANDPYWDERIKLFTRATGIEPEIPTQLIQARGQQLLEQGDTESFYRLQQYGQFTFTPEVVERTYVELLATSQNNDEHEDRDNYNYDWLERIKTFEEFSGISPTESQLGEIAFHLFDDKRIAPRSYSRISDIIEVFEKDFGVEFNESHAREVYKELFVAGNLTDLAAFKDKTGIVPEIQTDIVREKCDELMQRRDLQALINIKSTLEVEILPIRPETVQAEYAKLIEDPESSSYSREDINTFYALYEFTKMKPELSSEQMTKLYRKVIRDSHDGSYEQLERVVGIPPTESDLQDKIYQWLNSDSGIRKEDVIKFIEKHDLVVSREIVDEATMYRLEKINMDRFFGTIKDIKVIEEIAGFPVHLETAAVESVIQKLLETYMPAVTNRAEVNDIFLWFEEITGQKPSQGLVDLAYVKTLDQTLYKEKGDVTYINTWDWINKRYGLPSAAVIQSLYHTQLTSNGVSR